MKKITIRDERSQIEVLKSIRSPFATMRMTGAGAHKSKRDYDRNAQKREVYKAFKEYR